MPQINRRKTRKTKPTAAQVASMATWIGVDLTGSPAERLERAKAHLLASRVHAALAQARIPGTKG